MFSIFGERGSAYAPELASCKRGLQKIGGIPWIKHGHSERICREAEVHLHASALATRLPSYSEKMYLVYE